MILVPLYKEILAAIKKFTLRDLPGGPVVKNLPANLQGTQVQPLVQEDPTCRGETACEPQLLSLCALKPVLHNRRRLCSETRRLRTMIREQPPFTTMEKSLRAAVKTQHS